MTVKGNDLAIEDCRPGTEFSTYGFGQRRERFELISVPETSRHRPLWT
jgi:hypothetical protein